MSAYTQCEMNKTLRSIFLTMALPFSSVLFGQESISYYQKGIEQLSQTHISGKIGYQNALDFFTQSLVHDSSNISARYWKSHCELKLGKTEDALITSNSTLALLHGEDHSLKAKFLVTSGLIEKLNGDHGKTHSHFDQAIFIYKKVLKRDRHNYEAVMNICMILCYNGEKTEALEFLESTKKDGHNADLMQESRNYIEGFDLETELNKMSVGMYQDN